MSSQPMSALQTLELPQQLCGKLSKDPISSVLKECKLRLKKKIKKIQGGVNVTIHRTNFNHELTHTAAALLV